jgi:cleavage stimulation factor subunit 3
VEALEVKKDLPEVHVTYEKFLNLLRANLEELEQQANASTSNGDAPANPANPATPAPPANPANPPNGAEQNSQNTSFGSQTSDDKPPQVTELQKQRTEYGLVWIIYMRFARRAEGVRSSRMVFSKARRDRWTPWEVYEADGTLILILCFFDLPLTRTSSNGVSLLGRQGHPWKNF